MTQDAHGHGGVRSARSRVTHEVEIVDFIEPIGRSQTTVTAGSPPGSGGRHRHPGGAPLGFSAAVSADAGRAA
jgi:hypothetical protein